MSGNDIKTVLCFGDSNTYGYNPVDGTRYDKNTRWTGRLQKLLGKKYVVIEEGCNGRTTMFEEPGEPWKSGLPYVKPCMNSHKPVDVVILMLGTNDLKKVFNVSAEEIAAGAERLVQEIHIFVKEKLNYMPEIILVSPPEIGEGICESSFAGSFDETAIARSRQFPALYRAVANRNGCIFVDAATLVKPSKEDQLHLNAREHKKMARGIYHCMKKEGLLTK